MGSGRGLTNEEQLLNPAQQGGLVHLRPGPHDVGPYRKSGEIVPMRQAERRINGERAFADVGNFVTDPNGADISGNRGGAWIGRDLPVW